MNLVAGATTFPVPVRRDLSLKRSKDTVHRMEAHGEQPDSAPKPEGSLEVGVKVGFLDVL